MAAQHDVLVELRAGKMAYVDRMLKADARKGFIRVLQDEHGMNHFQWQERTAAEPEADVIVFPGEAVFEKIDRPGSRVFLLKFAAEPDRNLFFWAQEPDAAQDAEYVAAVNNVLNVGLEEMDVAAPEPAVAPAGAALLGALQQPTAAAAGAPGGAIQADLLASVLSNIMAGGGSAAAMQQQQELALGPPLGLVLKPELVVPLLQAPDILERLAPLLPEQQRSREAMTEIISSPQFRHQLALFSHALMAGELNLAQFGLQGQGFGTMEFLKAIQRQADAEVEQKAAQQQAQQPGSEQPPGTGQ